MFDPPYLPKSSYSLLTDRTSFSLSHLCWLCGEFSVPSLLSFLVAHEAGLFLDLETELLALTIYIDGDLPSAKDMQTNFRLQIKAVNQTGESRLSLGVISGLAWPRESRGGGNVF